MKIQWPRSFAGAKHEARAPRPGTRSAALLTACLGFSCYPRHTIIPRAASAEAIEAEVPLVASDAVYGPETALVTVVAFVDLARNSSRTLLNRLDKARRTQGGKVRYVIKQAPSCFHPHAQATAVAAKAVLDLAGPGAHYRFVVDLAAVGRVNPALLARLARDAGVAEEDLPQLTSEVYEAEVRKDQALADRLQARDGTYFVNGKRYSLRPGGAVVPVKEFEKQLTTEHEHARELYRGLSSESVYRVRVAENYAAVGVPESQPAEGRKAGGIDLSGAPATGPESAKVTVLHYNDLLSGCAAEDAERLEALQQRFAGDLRVVFKHGNFNEKMEERTTSGQPRRVRAVGRGRRPVLQGPGAPAGKGPRAQFRPAGAGS